MNEAKTLVDELVSRFTNNNSFEILKQLDCLVIKKFMGTETLDICKYIR